LVILDINFTIVYWLFAFIVSGFFGWKAVEIFKSKLAKPMSWPWWLYQIWFNFLGSLIGWLALWVLVRRYWTCIFCECTVNPSLWDLFAGFVAFIGVTGHLPYAVFGLISAVYIVGTKVAEKLVG
jgi:hypothetical protein